MIKKLTLQTKQQENTKEWDFGGKEWYGRCRVVIFFFRYSGASTVLEIVMVSTAYAMLRPKLHLPGDASMRQSLAVLAFGNSRNDATTSTKTAKDMADNNAQTVPQQTQYADAYPLALILAQVMIELLLHIPAAYHPDGKLCGNNMRAVVLFCAHNVPS